MAGESTGFLFYKNKSQSFIRGLIFAFLKVTLWPNGKSMGLGSSPRPNSACEESLVISFISVSQLFNGDSDTFCPELL